MRVYYQQFDYRIIVKVLSFDLYGFIGLKNDMKI